jgi:hypothetical protein
MASTPPIRANSVRNAGSPTFATAFASAIAALRSNDAHCRGQRARFPDRP